VGDHRVIVGERTGCVDGGEVLSTFALGVELLLKVTILAILASFKNRGVSDCCK
jgi:hypothetical protein